MDVIRALTILMAIAILSPVVIADTFEFSRLADDLEIAKHNSGSLFGSEITFLRTTLSRYELKVIRAVDKGVTRSTAEQGCRSVRGALCINSSFFDEKGLPLGLIISRGITLQKTHVGGNVLTGVFGMTREGPFISGRAEIPVGSITEAIQAGPRLLTKGEVVPGLKELDTSRQSGVCIDRAHRLVFFVVRSGFLGSSLREVLSFLKDPSIDCQEALNLDGGGSSQLYVSPQAPGLVAGVTPPNLSGNDSVPVFIALSPR